MIINPTQPSAYFPGVTSTLYAIPPCGTETTVGWKKANSATDAATREPPAVTKRSSRFYAFRYYSSYFIFHLLSIF